MRNTNRRSAIVVVVFVALMAFGVATIYQSCGDVNSNSKPEASASPSATEGKSSAQVNQAGTQTDAVTAKSADDPVTAKEITGTVKDERSGQAVTEAVVVLFNEGKAGSNPQMVSETSGKFRFKDVPLKVGVTYSLQSKAPGLCGEENISSQSVDSQKNISKDITLKPCQTQVNASQPTKTEEPGLAGISDGLKEMRAPLNSIKGWMQILGTASILLLVMFLLASLAFMLFVRNQIADARTEVANLYDWKRRVETEPKPQPQPQVKEPVTNLLSVSPDVLQTMQQLLVVLNKLATKSAGSGTQNDGREQQAIEGTAQHHAKVTAPAYQPPPLNPSQEPTDWYRDLFQNTAVSPAPLFVEIVSSETSPLASDRRICFVERLNHGSFVVHSAGEGDGWIYPNPRSNFMADHHQVFEGLDQRNFEQQITNIAAKKVRFQDGFWQLKL